MPKRKSPARAAKVGVAAIYAAYIQDVCMLIACAYHAVFMCILS